VVHTLWDGELLIRTYVHDGGKGRTVFGLTAGS